MNPVAQKRAVVDGLTTVGTWEPWQVILIFIPIVLLIGYFFYLKYGRKVSSTPSAPANGAKAAIDGLKTEVKEILISLREIRTEVNEVKKEITESKENDADHRARIKALERETFDKG